MGHRFCLPPDCNFHTPPQLSSRSRYQADVPVGDR
uniref:Uncharacterized protein n=1 Tax=Arundo donax TaxID=35708 RepID=A0A0A9AU27_ARUDO